jgi:hypothetical protein
MPSFLLGAVPGRVARQGTHGRDDEDAYRNGGKGARHSAHEDDDQGPYQGAHMKRRARRLAEPGSQSPSWRTLDQGSMTIPLPPRQPNFQDGNAWQVRLGCASSKTDLTSDGGSTLPGYRPMTIADLAEHLSRAADDKTRWKLVWEFLEEYRWEPDDVQPSLLQDEPSPTGDERWDVSLAEHLGHSTISHRRNGLSSGSCSSHGFRQNLKIQRADALVRAPAAFRKHGVYLSARDLAAA